jgi:hypothetical protein
MELLEQAVTQLKRVWIELVLLCLILLFFWTGAYVKSPPPIELMALKLGLVSGGILHGHIAGKLFFPKVYWTAGVGEVESDPFHKLLRIALYVVCVLGWTMGG